MARPVAAQGTLQHTEHPANDWERIVVPWQGNEAVFLIEEPDAPISAVARLSPFESFPGADLEVGYTFFAEVAVLFDPPFSAETPPPWLEELGLSPRETLEAASDHPCTTTFRGGSIAGLTVREAIDITRALVGVEGISRAEVAFGSPAGTNLPPAEPLQHAQRWISPPEYSRDGAWDRSSDFTGAWMLPNPEGGDSLGRGVTVLVQELNYAWADHADIATSYRPAPFGPPRFSGLLGVAARHPTMVAGMITADLNDYGVVGGAPETTFTDNVIVASVWEAQGYTWRPHEIDVVNNSWSRTMARPIYDRERGVMIDTPVPQLIYDATLIRPAIAHFVERGRCGKGGIVVASAGKFGDPLPLLPWYLDADLAFNSNNSPTQSLRYTITVGAVDENVRPLRFTEPGTNVLVSASITSGDDLRPRGCLTSSIREDESDTWEPFSGTSAAAPQVSAVAALLLEANPALTWRDVQHILVATADIGPFWSPQVSNATGLSHDYRAGFGRVDAYRAVRLGRDFGGLGDAVSAAIVFDAGRPYDDHSPIQSLTDPPPVPRRGITLTASQVIPPFTVDHVEIFLQIGPGDNGSIYGGHTWELEVQVISPAGTVSQIAGGLLPDGQRFGWIDISQNRVEPNAMRGLTSVQFWNEPSVGREPWKVRVIDHGIQDGQPARYSVSGIGLHVHGHAGPPLIACDFDVAGPDGSPFSDASRDIHDLEAVVVGIDRLRRSGDVSGNAVPGRPDGRIDHADWELVMQWWDEFRAGIDRCQY